MLMYAGLTDKDIERCRRGYYLDYSSSPVIRFRREGVEVAPEELIGKTFKIISQPVNGQFMIEIVE